MIRIHKHYYDLPETLEKGHGDIEALLHGKMSLDKFRHLKIFRNLDILERLGEIYHYKCGYCESQLPYRSFHAKHYRPGTLYPWLTVEWSNLLPICSSCNSAKENLFPLENEGDRITDMPKEYKEWVCNSSTLLKEKPLLLNPEIDSPHQHLAFYPDGRIYPIDGNLRGEVTIQTLHLNRPELVVLRKKVVDDLRGEFYQQLDKFLKISDIRQQQTQSLLPLILGYPFENLLKHADPKEEYSLLGKSMIQNFRSFFVHPIEQTYGKEIADAFQQEFLSFVRKKSVSLSTSSGKVELPKTQISKLKINQIKCFQEAEFQFEKNTNLLLGINGRGKSTILQLLALGLSEMERAPEVETWAHIIKQGEDQPSFEIELEIEDEEVPLQLQFTIDEKNRLHLIENSKWNQTTQKKFFILAYGAGRNILGQKNHHHQQEDQWGNIATLFGENTYLKNIDESHVYQLMESGFPAIQSTVNKVFKESGGKHGIQLDRYDTNSFYFKTQTAQEEGIPLQAMSEGFKCTFTWLFDMLVRAWEKGVDIENTEKITGIVLIDEIDLHLHPTWQRTILPTLEDIFPKVQFIVTTHSPFVVQSMKNNHTTLLSLNQEGVEGKLMLLEGAPCENSIEEIIQLTMGMDQ